MRKYASMNERAEDITSGPRPTTILASPAFVIAVVLLIVNDEILKTAIGSWWTGKLSDFTGLFALALFWSAFFPKRRPVIFGLISVAFLVWKSPLSEPLLAAWNDVGLWPLSRVVDYTDWVALIALVPAYWTARHSVSSASVRWAGVARRFTALAAAGAAVMAFAATSRAAPRYTFAPHSAYLVAAPRSRAATALDSLRLDSWLWLSRASVVDTVQGCIDKRIGKWICVRIELRDAPDCGTAVMLIDMQTIINKPDLPAVRQAFEHEVVEPLQSRLGTC